MRRRASGATRPIRSPPKRRVSRHHPWLAAAAAFARPPAPAGRPIAGRRHSRGCRDAARPARPLGHAGAGGHRRLAQFQRSLDLDHLRRRPHGQPVARFSSWRHVARSGICSMKRRPSGDSRSARPEFARALPEEVPPSSHVLRRSRTRQAQADDVKAVIESSRNSPCGPVLEVLVGGGITRASALIAAGRDAGSRSRRTARAADASALGGIRRSRRGTSVPPSACSKRPRRIACAHGEAPALVAEQLLRAGSRGIAPCSSAMKGLPARALCFVHARPHLLAAAGLAGDEHRDGRLRQTADGRTPPASPALARISGVSVLPLPRRIRRTLSSTAR